MNVVTDNAMYSTINDMASNVTADVASNMMADVASDVAAGVAANMADDVEPRKNKFNVQ